MIDINLESKDWDKTGEWCINEKWRIAPKGVSWIAEGSRIKVGESVMIGNKVSIGDNVTIGDNVSIGYRTKIGEFVRIDGHTSVGDYVLIGTRTFIGKGVVIGNTTTVGDRVTINDESTIDDETRVGEGASIGPGTELSIDLGCVDSYRKTLCLVKGVAWIGAGCRWFTLADAISHWKNKPDRVLTMCLMQSAIAIADHYGWKHS